MNLIKDGDDDDAIVALVGHCERAFKLRLIKNSAHGELALVLRSLALDARVAFHATLKMKARHGRTS